MHTTNLAPRIHKHTEAHVAEPTGLVYWPNREVYIHHTRVNLVNLYDNDSPTPFMRCNLNVCDYEIPE